MANYVPITSTEVHQGLQNAEPLFKEWAWLMYRKNSLGLPLEVIIKSGVRKTNTEALAYFAEYHKTIPMDGRVTWSDMTGKGITGALASKLSQIITNISSKGMGDPTRRYGTISHGFIRRLFAGEILRLRKKDLSFKKTPVQELPNELFDNGFDYDAVLEELNNPSSEDSRTHRNAVAKINRLLDRMEKIHNRVCEEMEMGIMTTAKESSFPKLEACLSHICRKDLEQVKGKIFEREDLINLTFMTWAKAILFYRQLEKDTQSMPLFSELFILPNQSDLGVGRLDELTIHKIDGVPPNTKQRRKLWKLGRRRYYSVGHAISTILEAFPGKHITFKVIDWKFAVGDGTRSMRIKMRDNIIETKDVKDQPLTDHKRQVERYLALSRFSYALKKQKHTEDLQQVFDVGNFTIIGQLIYFFPDQFPSFHDVTLTSEGMVSAFQDQVVLNYRRGAFQSQLRETHRAVFNHAAKIAVKGTDHINGVRALDDKVQLRLWEIKEKVETQKKQGQVAEFIQKHQAEPIFVDELKLIEIVGKDKKGLMFGMHVNVLEKGIMDGTIVADKGFNFRKGGKILCPVHGDTNPSMDVSFSRNRFICWTCGTGGWFVPGSVPADIQMAVRPRIKRDAYDTLMLPPRHQEIMKYAQVILQRNFLGSPAINYLSKERKLDPNLAFQVGAGYGNIDLIVSLLDLGFGYDELIHYGFLQISAGISQHTELVGNLLKKGLKLQELVRIVPGNRKRGIPDKPGLPYSVLDKRVTCPLEIKDTINNFYGRSVDLNCPKPLRHRKLPTDLCGEIPHGAFNMFRAAENAMRTDQKLIVVEAPLNAITLIQASDVKNVTAIMGVNNDVLFELLASFEGDIITAFDLDPEKFDKNKRQVGLAGQISTIKLRDTLRELDFHGKMNDFTIGFTQKEGLTCDLLPDGRKPHNYFNDINQYWVDHKEPFRILDYIQEIPKQLVWGSTKYPPDT